jgi:hypothetical protein
MDPAFQSRVKFAIRFENMTQPIRGTIWKNILVRSTPENSVNRPARDALVRQAEKEWSRKEKYNGRHIRNVVWNARVLTHPDEEKKLLEAIDEVLKDTDSFIDQIEKAKKEEDDKLLQGW